MRVALLAVVLAIIAVTVGFGIQEEKKSGNNNVSALPRSMKGYVLYSWQAQGRWNFTLIMGSNAVPSVDTITKGPYVMKSVDALKVQLARLPKDESISWIDCTLEGFHFEMPPKAIVKAVARYRKKLGLNLEVSPKRVPIEPGGRIYRLVFK
ncbi:MAG TPA: hypothetical protein VE398_16515 [Acidobacteriota bacterium]|nr:hypothetical protein [Acidobacteriota bacterium]